MKTEMAMTRSRAARIVPTVMIMLLLTACGLKGDLYIPTEETPGEAAEAPPEGPRDTEDQDPQEADAPDENDTDPPDPLSGHSR